MPGTDGPDTRGEIAGRRLIDHLARLVVEGVADYAIIALNPEGRIVSWNPGAVRILGYTEEEAVGRRYPALLEPGRADEEALAEAAEHGHREVEGWRVRKDGSRLWAHELVTALRSEAGHLVAFAVLLRDRTERRLAEEARLRSEQMFTGIVNASADGIVAVDESQRIVLFNRAAEAIFGYGAEEVVGRPLELLVPEPYREAHHRHVREFAESPVEARLMGGRTGRTLLGLRSDGEVFPLEAAISKVRVGEEWLFTAVVRDVSERVRETRAREFLVRAAVVLDSSLDYETTLREVAHLAISEWADWCIVYTVEEGGAVRRQRIAHSNPELEELLERLRDYPVLPQEEHPARRVIDTGEPQLIADVPPSLLETVAQDEEHLEILRRLRLRSAVLAPLLARGRSLGAIGLFSSAPRRRYDDFDLWLAAEVGRRAGLAMDNARLYGEARQAVRARDEVVSVVSHDLRNPLNSITMSAQLLGEQLREHPETAGLQGLAGIVLRSAERMDRLIQDLLDITRIETGRLHLEPQPVRSRPLLEEACEMFRSMAAERELRLDLEVEEGLPPVQGDPDRLYQVVSNLVGNALKFTSAGGRVTLSAHAAPGAVVFGVEDTGVGIPREHLPHLFDRFWQARRADRRGIGLGLPIVKGIVEAHGGEVRVESEEGVGTTFLFSIPSADA